MTGTRITVQGDVHVAILTEDGRDVAYIYGMRVDVTDATVTVTRTVGERVVVLTVMVQSDDGDKVLFVTLDRATGQALEP